jgi:hypothetical protein
MLNAGNYLQTKIKQDFINSPGVGLCSPLSLGVCFSPDP